MRAEVWLKNYRAFDEASNARWILDDGFIAFVGVNNSGKSSLIRFFHEVRPMFEIFAGIAGYNGSLTDGTGQPAGFRSVADHEEVLCNRNDRPASAEFRLLDVEEQEPSMVRFVWTRPGPLFTVEFEYENTPATAIAIPGNDQAVVEVTGTQIPLSLNRYQQLFLDLRNSIYLGPFRNAVNVGGGSDYYDLQIGQAFIEQWDAFKTGNGRAQNRAAVAVENELASIFGLDSLQINAAPGNQTLQIIADNEPYQLQEQGAGLAQFIVVLAYVATRSPSWIFIDEPELNLHPSLQLDFLTTLARYSRYGVAFATHSIGLARAIGQTVYTVRRGQNGRREVRVLDSTPNIVEFLGEVSLSGYQELGFTGILLVEGTTEVPVVQQWLRAYGIEHTTVLIPLGGSSMIKASSAAPLAEIKRITTNVAVLIDSERAVEGAPLEAHRQAFVDTCSQLGFQVHVTTKRATENYFTDAAIKAVKGESYAALDAYQKLSDAPRPWAKSENWKISGQMTKTDLEDTDIGQFLAQLRNGDTDQ